MFLTILLFHPLINWVFLMSQPIYCFTATNTYRVIFVSHDCILFTFISRSLVTVVWQLAPL